MLLSLENVCSAVLSCVLLFSTPWCLPGSSVHGDSPEKNTGMGCHALLQGIFPTKGSNPCLQHCRWILYHLSHPGSPRILEWVLIPSPGDVPSPEIKLGSAALQADSFPAELPGKLQAMHIASQTESERMWLLITRSR